MLTKSKKEKLEYAKQKFADSWFDGLKKSWKDDVNKKALKESYNITSKFTLDVVLENTEKLKSYIQSRIENFSSVDNLDENLVIELKSILVLIQQLEKIDINEK